MPMQCGQKLKGNLRRRLNVAMLFVVTSIGVVSAAELTDSHDKAQSFWAYHLPQKNQPPQVRNSNWPLNEIDRFILANLEARELTPVPAAQKSVLVRRAYYDLIGLPPTPQQLDEFASDESADAFARLVDDLMARPQFGERWGRHWFDVVRFGESVTLRGFIFKEAWRYRDYVIDAFNRDLPYDQFVQEQIAGDLMPAPILEERRRRIIATTFLALGNTNLEEQDKEQLRMDVVDEQLDTIGKAFLAQTLGCARCHDHKFDPIPTRDYYAMAGILRSTKTLEHANVSNWIELPLPLEPEQEAIMKSRETAVAALQTEIKMRKERLSKLGGSNAASASQRAVLKVSDLPGVVVDDAHAKRVGEWKPSQYSGRYIGDGYLHDSNNGKGEKTLTFQPELLKAGKYEVRLAYSPGSNRTTAAPVTVFSADGESTVHVNQRQTPPIDDRFVSLGQFRFEQNGQGFVLIANQDTDGHVIADAVQFIPADSGTPGVATVSPETGETQADQQKELTIELKQLESDLKKLTDSGPKRPMAMTVKEAEKIEDSPIHVRGSVHNLGPVVARGFLQMASYGEPPRISKEQSGRRELAQWIASRSNPMTARVMVNRVWHWLFGAGLVRTTDNFGSTGELPSHPELLDYLAVSFMENGWSVKRLIREIMLSRTYQISTQPEPSAIAADPENRLLGRTNRRRLDAECLRDSILLVSGQLKLTSGGPTIKPGATADYGYTDTDTLRSVYVPAFRNALPELFEAFDFADPSTVTGRRSFSTVAPQALFLLNHPFIGTQARLAAKRLLAQPITDDRTRIGRVYRMVLGRLPAPNESRIALKFLEQSQTPQANEDRIDAWAQLYQALFASIDFRYLD